MRLNRILPTLFLAVFFQASAFAQQIGTKTCDMPVVVTDLDNQLVRNLTPADFSVLVGGTPSAVQDVSIDEGPKRIVLILDASANVPKSEWEMETQMAKTFVGNARPHDQFALLMVGEEGAEVSFLSSDQVAGQLKKITRSQAPEKIYDALLNAVSRLDPPQFGDAIFLFGHHEDFGSAVSFDHVAELVLKNGTRFYGISFADRLSNLPPGFDLNKPLPTGFGRSNLESLSAQTGYFFSFHALHALNLPGQMQLFKNFLADLYAGIAEPYRLSIPATAIKDQIGIEVDVTDLQARKINRNRIHYPHFLFPCAAPASTP